MTRQELLERWQARRESFQRYGAAVDGARLLDECLVELRSMLDEEDSDLLTLEEAAAWSGYSADHVGRLLREGKLANLGRKHRPRVRRGDLPTKPHALRSARDGLFLSGGSKRQIAMSVVNSESKETR